MITEAMVKSCFVFQPPLELTEAAEPIMRDEGTRSVSPSLNISGGGCFFGYFLCSYKESNSPIKGETKVSD